MNEQRKFWARLLAVLLIVCAGIVPGRQAPSARAAAAKQNADGADMETKITISAAGDCTFGSDRITSSSVNFDAVYRRQKDPSYFFKKVKKYFAKDDMTIVNFEGTLTKRTTRADKKFAFKGDPGYANILKKGSVEAVGFANNHCRDFGDGSYTDTIECFKKNEIVYSSYSRLGIYKVKDKKIGMISVNGLEGTAASKQLIHNGLKKLKEKKTDLCIVNMHAGIEYQTTPSGDQRAVARYAVDEGADLVLGHHPHILQGVEQYKGSYIVYSLGNFCFGGNSNPSDKDTMIFQQTFVFQGGKLKKSRSTAKVIPCSLSSASGINNYQPMPATGEKRTRIVQKIDRLCRPLGLKVQKNGIIGKNQH